MSKKPQKPVQTQSEKNDLRKSALKDALRENLHRRKSQARKRTPQKQAD